jgi:hypothetical protein
MLTLSTPVTSLTDFVLASCAIAALFISILSLALQWYLWLTSGPKLKLNLSSAVFAGGFAPHDKVMLSIGVSNLGRGSTQISNLWIKPKGSTSNIVFLKYEMGSPSLPTVLSPASELTWYLPLGEVESQLLEHGDKSYKVAVGLPGGKEAYSKWQRVSSPKFQN